MENKFLPICKQDMIDRGWEQLDFVLVTGDAYVDHHSFGTAIISRVLENAGYKEENIKNAPAVAGAFSFYFCKWIILQCKLLCFP